MWRDRGFECSFIRYESGEKFGERWGFITVPKKHILFPMLNNLSSEKITKILSQITKFITPFYNISGKDGIVLSFTPGVALLDLNLSSLNATDAYMQSEMMEVLKQLIRIMDEIKPSMYPPFSIGKCDII
jgi:hypothetical protein